MAITPSNPPNQITNAQAAIPVYQAPSQGLPFSGQQVSTTSAAVLTANNAATGAISFHANKANTGTIYIGSAGITSTTGYPLAAGDTVTLYVANTNLVYMLGTNTSDVLSFIGN